MCSVISETVPLESSSSSAAATSATSVRKSISMPVGVVPLELLRDGEELLDVLDARLVLRVAAGAQRVDVAAALQQQREHVEHRDRGQPLLGGTVSAVGLVEQVRDRSSDRPRHLRPEPELARMRAAHRGTSIPLRSAYACELRLGRRPDAALGRVHDAAQRERVRRVRDRDQVRHRILDLGALVELGAAEHAVRQRRADEDLLQRTGLRVGAVEDRDVAVAPCPRRAACSISSATNCASSWPEYPVKPTILSPAPIVGEQVLGFAVEVVRDHRVGGVEDVLRRPVVLLEQDRPSSRGSRARTRRCCGCPRRGTRRSTGRSRRPR